MKSSSYALPITLSLLGHLALVAVLLFSFDFEEPPKPSNQPGKVIQAVAVSSERVNELAQQLKNEQQAARQKEQERQRKLKEAEEAARQKRLEEEQKAKEAAERRKQEEQRQKEAREKREVEEKKRLQAEQQRKEEERKAQEAAEKRRQAEEEKKRIEEEARKKREAEEKRRKEEEARKKREEEERRKKEEAERKRKEEEARRQAELDALLEEQAAEAAELRQQQLMSERQKYLALIESKIYRFWNLPDNPKGECEVKIRLSPSGLVLDINKVQGPDLLCFTARNAIKAAEPLPMPKDEELVTEFREIRIKMKPEDLNR